MQVRLVLFLGSRGKKWTEANGAGVKWLPGVSPAPTAPSASSSDSKSWRLRNEGCACRTTPRRRRQESLTREPSRILALHTHRHARGIRGAIAPFACLFWVKHYIIQVPSRCTNVGRLDVCFFCLEILKRRRLATNPPRSRLVLALGYFIITISALGYLLMNGGSVAIQRSARRSEGPIHSVLDAP